MLSKLGLQACGAAVLVSAIAVSPVRFSPAAAEPSTAPGDAAPVAYQPISGSEQHFYIRGDFGNGDLDLGRVAQSEITSNGGTFLSQSIGDTTFLGLGIGLQFNKQLRADLTAEYRGAADVRALDNLAGDLLLGDGTLDGALQANTRYAGRLTSYVGLLNGYVDLFNWQGFTPYIGAGAGFAHNRVTDLRTKSTATFTDASTGEVTVQNTTGTSRANGQTNFAWALMAGTAYDLNPNAKLDIGYRYLNLGSGVAMASSIINCDCGTVGGPLQGSDLDSHEFRIGLRWAFSSSLSGGDQ